MSTDIKDILYSVLNEIGSERIRIDIAKDIKTSESICKDILNRCTSRMGHEVDDERLVTLCESLLHFLLTASLLPSERKVIVRGINLDIVIPSVRVLNRTPDRSIVIQMTRGDLEAKLRNAISVQPLCENIWLVSASQLPTDYRNYHIGSEELSFTSIVCDINRFLSEKGEHGLKLLP